MIEILAEGPGWLAVNKPAGLSVHNDAVNLLTQLVTQISSPANRHPRLHPVHRLDQATSGVMLVATNEGEAQRLQQAFAQRRVNKYYVAVVKGEFADDEGDWRWPLTDKAEGRRDPQGAGAKKECLTHYRVQKTNGYLSLLELTLHTGRQHQIRRHAVLAKHPVVGDARYADPRWVKRVVELTHFNRLALHSSRLEVGDIKVEAPITFDELFIDRRS